MRPSNIGNWALALLLAVALAAPGRAAEPERILEESWPAAEIGAVRFDLSVGEVEVGAGASGKVEVEVLATCKRGRADCGEALGDLELSGRTRGEVLRIELDGYPKWGKSWIEVEAKVTLPATLDFELDMGVGEVNIEGLAGNLEVELGVGEVTIDSKPDHLRVVSLDVGVGEAEIYGHDQHIEGRRSFLVGSEVYWSEGKGTKRLEVEVGVGEVTVRLD